MIFSWQGPDSNHVKEVIPTTVFSSYVNEDGAFDCEVSCGSDGEVANDPSEGHQFASRITDDWTMSDVKYDNRHTDDIPWETGKASTWVMQALSAKDQLRQRVAWGLSQIFVVSSQDVGENHLSEMWTHYYDIFVRGAFGNFFDVVREVTYNPIMGKYLTHVGSTSHEHDSRFPNENFARELMQLFTIGTEKLNVDGSFTLVNGSTVPTYTTQNILNFARVFTGFNYRGVRRNTEMQWTNYFDPMSIKVTQHDRYPKPDLYGQFLGDGLPHCDSLPPFSWLSAGAKYVYVGRVIAEDVLELAAGSALFGKFCGGDATVCDAPAAILLTETLPCVGDECEHESVGAVSVGDFKFQYVPECIYFHFNERTPNATANRSVELQPGYCAGGDGARLWDGRVTLDTLDEGETRKAECLAKCEAFGGTGCEFVSGNSWGNGCYGHTSEVVKHAGELVSHWCWTF
jgi:cullin-associated NEDD8-dissociated protein 1